MRIRPLVAAPGMQETDMSVFTDTRLMNGQHDTVSIVFFQSPFMLRQLRPLQSRIGRTLRSDTWA